MNGTSGNPAIIYPVLGGNADFWFLRVAGHGLGNCFYTYFHAVALAEKYGAAVVSPAWASLKIGPLLRGAHSNRSYWRMFKPFTGEIHGVKKFLTLARSYRKRVVLNVGDSTEPVVVGGAVNFVVSSKFTFRGLHVHRSVIRERILGTINDPVPENHSWGNGPYIAIHIRLGDFAETTDTTLLSSGQPNLRIPMSWYMNLISTLRRQFADRRIHIFSDGTEAMLRPILGEGATLYQSGSDMTDLLAMSGASILVGSNSTYSRWAAFLGNMPTIWLKTHGNFEKPTAPDVPISYVPLDAANPALWAM